MLRYPSAAAAVICVAAAVAAVHPAKAGEIDGLIAEHADNQAKPSTTPAGGPVGPQAAD